MTLSVNWRLGSEGFLFEAMTKERGLSELSQRIAYSDLEAQTTVVDHMIDKICRRMMNEIDDRCRGQTE